jgi:hypothetical protein
VAARRHIWVPLGFPYQRETSLFVRLVGNEIRVKHPKCYAF